MTPKYAWSVVGLLWIVALLNYLDRQLINTMVVPIREHFGLSASYREQLRDVPDGSKEVIKIQKPPEESQIHGGN